MTVFMTWLHHHVANRPSVAGYSGSFQMLTVISESAVRMWGLLLRGISGSVPEEFLDQVTTVCLSVGPSGRLAWRLPRPWAVGLAGGFLRTQISDRGIIPVVAAATLCSQDSDPGPAGCKPHGPSTRQGCLPPRSFMHSFIQRRLRSTSLVQNPPPHPAHRSLGSCVWCAWCGLCAPYAVWCVGVGVYRGQQASKQVYKRGSLSVRCLWGEHESRTLCWVAPGGDCGGLPPVPRKTPPSRCHLS